MNLASPKFGHNEMIPDRYTCKGMEFNPPLEITDVPKNADSLALIMDDPDAPMGTFDHWIVYNIEPTTEHIKEDSVPGTQGKNSRGTNEYVGPCPPSGTHRYFFKLFALDIQLDIAEGATKDDIRKAMQGHILEKAEMIGLFSK